MDDHRSLGAYLRAHREAQELTIEGLSAATRIMPRLVRALEEGCYDDLPSAVYVRGFVRAYCAQLDMAPDHALGLLAAETAPPEPTPIATVPVEPPCRTAWERAGRAGLISGGLLLAASAVYSVVWLTEDRTDPSGPAAVVAVWSPPEPASPARLGGDHGRQPDPTVTVVPSGPPAAASAAGTVATTPAERVLVMRADETTWVRVKPDGRPTSEVTLSPGGVQEFRSTGRFLVTVGNAGGVRLELDGTPLPTLGRPGEVVRDLVLPRSDGP
jgi:cytoskeletal protein RodZ